ncbi:MAG: hypothetical protein H0X73_06885 [Chthoniobacterales bacterium]|nr:hypothetical protein [Chthoniobacterales bacterium]
MMNDLAQRNGRDLDGTAIIASVSEIDNLSSKGFIKKTLRPLSDPLRYVVCPVIKDPRDGGIAPDQFSLTPASLTALLSSPNFCGISQACRPLASRRTRSGWETSRTKSRSGEILGGFLFSG